MQNLHPCLWFNNQAEEAARFYVSIFRNSRILHTSHFNGEGQEIHGKKDGEVMTVSFELDGKEFTALNGGPMFSFSPAVSFVILCKDQEEVDHYWENLGKGGNPEAKQCGWLQDQYGVSWQVVPEVLYKLLEDPDREKARRVTKVMLEMGKLIIEDLENA